MENACSIRNCESNEISSFFSLVSEDLASEQISHASLYVSALGFSFLFGLIFLESQLLLLILNFIKKIKDDGDENRERG